MFSQIIDQKEHKNNWYKFEPATWCYKQHSIPQGTLHLETDRTVGRYHQVIFGVGQIISMVLLLTIPPSFRL